MASNAKPAAACEARAGEPELAGSVEEAQHSTLLRARRAALVALGPWPIERPCIGERRLSFGARPWCDVPVEASTIKPAAAGKVRGSPPADSGDEVQHASLLSTQH